MGWHFHLSFQNGDRQRYQTRLESLKQAETSLREELDIM